VLQQGKPIRVFGKGTPGSIALAKLVKDSDPAVSSQNYAIVNQFGNYVMELDSFVASFETYTLTVSDTVHEIKISDLLIGEVWIAGGQSNMAIKVSEMNEGSSTMAAASNNQIRIFFQEVGNDNGEYPTTPATDVRNGSWKTADLSSSIAECSAIGYSFATELFRLLKEERLSVPVAIINTAKGGSKIQSWLPRAAMLANAVFKNYVQGQGYTFDEEPYSSTDWTNYNRPSALYNTKIAPLFQFQIKGVLWYQGESDANYNATMIALPLLIDTWSAGFNQNDELLDFVFVQIAPYDGADPLLGESSQNYSFTTFPAHRQAQLDVVRMTKYASHACIVPIYDISLVWQAPSSQFLWTDPIHPLTKIPVGQRCGKVAYSKYYYGVVDFEAPMVESFVYDATSITITFSHVARGLALFKNPSLGVTTVEIFHKNGIREYVTCSILDANRIQIQGIDTSDVNYFAYSYLTRNESSNLGSSFGTPAIPFKIKLE
jgi:sialate O-acetylesterase